MSNPASAGAGRDGSRLRQERYRFEPEAMRIVQAVKDHLLPAMDEEQGGWLLGQILDLVAHVRLAVPDPLASSSAPQGEIDSTLRALKNVGVDTTCSACMEVAFTGATTNAHTCRASSLPVRASGEPQK